MILWESFLISFTENNMFVQNKEALASNTFPKTGQFDENNNPIYRGDGKWIDYAKVKPTL